MIDYKLEFSSTLSDLEKSDAASLILRAPEGISNDVIEIDGETSDVSKVEVVTEEGETGKIIYTS